MSLADMMNEFKVCMCNNLNEYYKNNSNYLIWPFDLLFENFWPAYRM